MMENKIKRINLEIGLFLNELNATTKNVTEIDCDTVELLQTTLTALNTLIINSSVRKTSVSTENDITRLLKDKDFEYRRIFNCRPCGTQFRVNQNAFEEHMKRKEHAMKTIELPPLHGSRSLSNLSSVKQLLQSKSVNSTSQINEIASIEEPLVSFQLDDVFKIDGIFKTIKSQAEDLLLRSDERVSMEKQVINILNQHIKSFNGKLKVQQFGSTYYGFGGAHTNLNIWVDTKKAEQSPAIVLHEFEKIAANRLSTTTSHIGDDFDVLSKTFADRVIGQQLKMIHKGSGIECYLLFDDFPINQASINIHQVMAKSPICRYLTAYVRAWQNTLNVILSEHGKTAFEFNTYILSVLVIFYLQKKSLLPSLADIRSFKPDSQSSLPIGSKKFKKQLLDFYLFYGREYQKKNHLISTYITHWLCIKKDPNQNPRSAEKTLRDGIKHSPLNWKNCTMHVQDPLRYDVNITAEISNEQVDMFQECCMMFNNYLKSCTTINPSDFGLIVNEDPKPISSTDDKPNMPDAPQNHQNTEPNELFKEIFSVSANLLTRDEERIRNEKNIMRIFTIYIESFDPTLIISSFGSSTYGFGGSNTNFNILINAAYSRKYKTANLISAFNQFLKQSHSILLMPSIETYFNDIILIPESRVLKSQLKMLHKESNIECVLLSDDVGSLVKSTQIIQSYIEIEPMCSYMIAVIKAIQKVTNAFQFNTYIISVLVIFFLQKNYEFPVIGKLDANMKMQNEFQLEKLVLEFFNFYANQYQMKNQIISAHFGRWQRRDLDRLTNPDNEQKKLKENIRQHQKYWNEGCAMCVQDLVRLGVNITAEVSKQDAINFQLKCAELFLKLKKAN